MNGIFFQGFSAGGKTRYRHRRRYCKLPNSVWTRNARLSCYQHNREHNVFHELCSKIFASLTRTIHILISCPFFDNISHLEILFSASRHNFFSCMANIKRPIRSLFHVLASFPWPLLQTVPFGTNSPIHY